MSDEPITFKLRDWADLEREHHGMLYPTVEDHLGYKAAAEIERLEAQLAECQQERDSYQQAAILSTKESGAAIVEIARLQAQVDRAQDERNAAEAQLAECQQELTETNALLMDAIDTCNENAAKVVVTMTELEQRKDEAYLERNRVVALAARMAISLGYKAGISRTAIEGWSDDWNGCVFMDLPTGQASWHYHDSHAFLFEDLPVYDGEWDGHSTPEKYERLSAYQSTDSAEARAARLEAAIRDYLDGNYDHPRKHRPNGCEHGRVYYESCDECTDMHFSRALEGT